MRKSIIKSIAMLALMLVSAGAWAQNTGTNPYLNSTHSYSVTASAMSGSLSWAIDGGGAIVGASDQASVSIQWTALGTHQITVTELTSDGCSTERKLDITVQANTFNLAVADLADDCANGSGTVLANDPNPPATTRTFTVNMTGDNAQDYSFDYALTTTTSAVISNVTIAAGASTIYNGANLSGTGVTIPAGNSSFTVTVTIDSRWNTQDDVTLAISNAQDALSTPETDTTDNSDTAVIYALPNTTGITAN